MILAADAPAVGPPWLAILLMCLAALATLVTAAMPYLVEKTKQRALKPPPEISATPASTTAAVDRADKALSLIEESMKDMREQRDQADNEVRRLQKLIAKRETELRRRGWVD